MRLLIPRARSINHDPHTGVGFISTIEARDYPFYAVQWHPERPQFDWTENEGINHGPASVRAMFAFAEFFVSEARKNTHRCVNFITSICLGWVLRYNYLLGLGSSYYYLGLVTIICLGWGLVTIIC